MATIIEQAKKGRRNAMTALYESSKQKVYDISRLLLGSEAEAADATSYAYGRAVLDTIHAIAIPLEKKKKKRIYQIGAAVLAVCLLVIGVFVIM